MCGTQWLTAVSIEEPPTATLLISCWPVAEEGSARLRESNHRLPTPTRKQEQTFTSNQVDCAVSQWLSVKICRRKMRKLSFFCCWQVQEPWMCRTDYITADLLSICCTWSSESQWSLQRLCVCLSEGRGHMVGPTWPLRKIAVTWKTNLFLLGPLQRNIWSTQVLKLPSTFFFSTSLINFFFEFYTSVFLKK